MDIKTTGYSALKENIEEMRRRMTGPVARKAVIAGARVIAAAMEERAPVRETTKTPQSTSLDPGVIKADIGVRSKTIDGQVTAISGPSEKTAHVARWVEYGHRDVHGGYSKVLADGRQRGPGTAGGEDVPAHPFLRPAFEASVSEAEAARDKVLHQGLEGNV